MMKFIPVSNGEILDRFIILEIKLSYVQDETQKSNIQKEQNLLKKHIDTICTTDKILNLYYILKNINNELWIIEDKLRYKETIQLFDKEFIDLARNVYKNNDLRANIKKQINILTQSDLIEEKIYYEKNK